MMIVRYCPVCGLAHLTYFDDEIRQYAHCTACNIDFGVSEFDYTREIYWIIQKLKSIDKHMKRLKEKEEEQ